MIEIVCVLVSVCWVLIFDELMVMLSVYESVMLFECIDVLCCEGVVIVYIFYCLDELVCIVDCIVVLCDGKLVIDVLVVMVM